jgi:hypothetical protein
MQLFYQCVEDIEVFQVLCKFTIYSVCVCVCVCVCARARAFVLVHVC